MLVPPPGVDAMAITFGGKRSDSSTQTLTVTARVTSRHTYSTTLRNAYEIA